MFITKPKGHNLIVNVPAELKGFAGFFYFRKVGEITLV